MFRITSQSPSLNKLLFNVFQAQADTKFLESKLAQAKVNPDVKRQLDSLFGKDSTIKDSFFTSNDPNFLLKELRYVEIDELIEKGESLSAKGVSYEEYYQYSIARLEPGNKDSYDFLCYEGKNRKHFEDQAKDVYNRWAKGEKFSDAELEKLKPYAKDYQSIAAYQRELNQAASLLSKAFEEKDIVPAEGKSIELKLNASGKFEVFGIDDPEQKEIAEQIINEKLKGSLLGGYLNIPGYEKSSDWSKKNTHAYVKSTDIARAEEFLKKNGISVGLEDLSIDWRGNICGDIPKDLLEKLNGAKYSNDKEEWDLAHAKTSIQNSINALKEYGGYEKMPQIDYYLSFSNGRLEIVDKEHGKVIPDDMKI